MPARPEIASCWPESCQSPQLCPGDLPVSFQGSSLATSACLCSAGRLAGSELFTGIGAAIGSPKPQDFIQNIMYLMTRGFV